MSERRLFVRDARPLIFFVPPCPKTQEVCSLITRFGGQIYNTSTGLVHYGIAFPEYGLGLPLHIRSEWIYDCIKSQRLIDPVSYTISGAKVLGPFVSSNTRSPSNKTRQEFTKEDDDLILEATIKLPNRNTDNFSLVELCRKLAKDHPTHSFEEWHTRANLLIAKLKKEKSVQGFSISKKTAIVESMDLVDQEFATRLDQNSVDETRIEVDSRNSFINEYKLKFQSIGEKHQIPEELLNALLHLSSGDLELLDVICKCKGDLENVPEDCLKRVFTALDDVHLLVQDVSQLGLLIKAKGIDNVNDRIAYLKARNFLE